MEFKFLLIIILVKDILLEQIKDYKIGLSLPFKDYFWESYYNNFMNNSIKFLNEGINFTIIVRFSKKSMSIQQADIEYLLSQKINVLIIVPQDTKASKNIIKYCEIIDIPIISFNRLIYNTEIQVYISPNITKVGELQAQFLLDNYGKTNKTKFLIMKGPNSDLNSELYYEGTINKFKSDNRTKDIVDDPEFFIKSEIVNWEPKEGEILCNSLKDDFINNLGYIVAANDDIGKACIIGLKNKNRSLNEIYMAGHDNAQNTTDYLFYEMKNNYFTVDMNQKSDTYIALNVSKNLCLGRPFDFFKTIKNQNYDIPYLTGDVIPITYQDFLSLKKKG